MADAATLLVVDDQPEVARHLIHACAARFPEASITAVGSGEEALAALEHGCEPHAILLDLTLPRLSGFEILGQLRALPSYQSVPVIILTVDQSDAARHTCTRLGASYFQVKPTSRTGFTAFATFLRAALEHGAFTRPGIPSAF